MQDSTAIPPSHRARCSKCNKPVWKGKTSAAVQVCRDCRSKMRSHGTEVMYSKGKCRCDLCREAKSALMRDYCARRRSEGRPIQRANRSAPRPKGPCLRCGKLTAALRCKPCGAAYRRSMRRRRAAALRKVAAASIGTRGALVWVQGRCCVCRETFAPSPGSQSRYCSPDCRARAQARRNWISYPERLAIYEAAGWTCQLCGDPMSREYSSQDPWSPTLDHIVPRSKGGTDDLSNLRASHMWCNSVRGDESYYKECDLQPV